MSTPMRYPPIYLPVASKTSIKDPVAKGGKKIHRLFPLFFLRRRQKELLDSIHSTTRIPGLPLLGSNIETTVEILSGH